MLVSFRGKLFDLEMLDALVEAINQYLTCYPERTAFLLVRHCSVNAYQELKDALDSRHYSVSYAARPGTDFIRVEVIPHWLDEAWDDHMSREDADTLNRLYG